MSDRQPRYRSFIEAVVGTALGYIISWAITPTVLGWFGVHVGSSQSAGISAIFTAVSIARGYVVRRIFA